MKKYTVLVVLALCAVWCCGSVHADTVALWTFDTVSAGATTVPDESGNGHTLTVGSNAEVVESGGKLDGYLLNSTAGGSLPKTMAFNEDVRGLPLETVMNGANPFTFEAHVRWDGLGNSPGDNWDTLIWLGHVGTDPTWTAFGWRPTSDGNIFCTVKCASGFGAWQYQGGFLALGGDDLGVWVHLALTYDPVTNEANVWYNGSLSQTIPNLRDAAPTTWLDGPLVLELMKNSWIGAAKDNWLGAIDQVRISDEIL